MRGLKIIKMEGVNISKAFSDKTDYQTSVYFDNVLVVVKVTINVNGVDFIRNNDETILYKLNINLQPGTYQLTPRYHGDDEYLSSQIIKESILLKAQKDLKRFIILLRFNTNQIFIYSVRLVLLYIHRF